MIKQYIAYLRDNPNGYWFRRKVYGWGWTPATWQGWTVLAVYVLGIVAFSLALDKNTTDKEALMNFGAPVVVLSVLFILIAYKKGEKPRWQWGFEKKEL